MEHKTVKVDAYQCPHCESVHLTTKSLNACINSCQKAASEILVKNMSAAIKQANSITELKQCFNVYAMSRFRDKITEVVSFVVSMNESFEVEFVAKFKMPKKTLTFSDWNGASGFMGEWVGDAYRNYKQSSSYEREGRAYIQTVTATVGLNNIGINCFRRLQIWRNDNNNAKCEAIRKQVENAKSKFTSSSAYKVLQEGINEVNKQINELTFRRQNLMRMQASIGKEVEAVEPPVAYELKEISLKAIE